LVQKHIISPKDYLTPWNTAFAKKLLAGAQLLEENPVSYGTQGFVAIQKESSTRPYPVPVEYSVNIAPTLKHFKMLFIIVLT
jgi:hypothetical protein